MLITIDGGNGLGKSTAGRKLAARLGIDFFSTGRLIRWLALDYKTRIDAGQRHETIMPILHGSISNDTLRELKDRPSPELCDASLTPYFGTITADAAMLKVVDTILAEYRASTSVVFDGRNLYEVFPDADVHFYFASSKEDRLRVLAASEYLTLDQASLRLDARDAQERSFDVPYSRLHVLDPFAYSLEGLVDAMTNIVERGDQASVTGASPLGTVTGHATDQSLGGGRGQR